MNSEFTIASEESRIVSTLYCFPSTFLIRENLSEATCLGLCSGCVYPTGCAEQFQPIPLFESEGKGHHWICTAGQKNLPKTNYRCSRCLAQSKDRLRIVRLRGRDCASDDATPRGPC